MKEETTNRSNSAGEESPVARKLTTAQQVFAEVIGRRLAELWTRSRDPNEAAPPSGHDLSTTK